MAGMAGVHPFVPGAWKNPVFLTWLRRTHGWIGLSGAALGLMYSITTLFMEHNDFGLGREQIRTNSTISVPASATNDLQTFGAFMKQELDMNARWIPLQRNSDLDEMEASGQWNIRFNSPRDTYEIRYVKGNPSAELRHINRSFVDGLNRLHRAEGVNMKWKIIADVFTFALLFLAVTGIMLWTKMHGWRIFAVVLFVSGSGVALWTLTASA